MASGTFWGNWTPNSSTNQRMRVSVEWNVTDPSPGATSVTVSVTARLHAGYSFNWVGALQNRWGTYIGGTVTDESFHAVVPTNGSMVIYTSSRSVGLASSAQSLSIGISVRNIGYVGPYTANVTGNIPIPASPTNATPTNVVLSWPDSNSPDMRLTWGGGPAHEFQYRRRTNIGSSTAAWTNWTAYSGVERSSPFDITAIGGRYEYQFRVRRGTGSAASAWANSNVLRAFLQPDPPTNIRVERTSDNRHTVRWDASDTFRRPVAYFSINRFSTKSGTWVRIAAPSRTARSWVDTRGYSNDYIGYRVFAVNAWNGIESVDSAWVRTTPAAATEVDASRTGPNAAMLTWVNNATAATGITIQEQTSSDLGVTWSGWADRAGSIDFTPSAQSRALSGLDPALWYRFRVVHIAANDAPNPTLYNYSEASEIIRPAAAPLAPDLWAPSGVVSSTSPVMFAWHHRPTDGSAQTAYELQYRPAGSGTWTTVTASNTSVYGVEVPIPTSDIYEARVRTKGQHADWSPWSTLRTFEVLDPPTVTITSPEEATPYPSNRVVVEFDYADATGAIMTGSRATLLDSDGEFLVANFGDGDSTSVPLPFVLENFTEYTVELEATSGTGLRSEIVSVTFTTDFLPPAVPDFEGTWEEEGGLVRLGVVNHPGDGGVTTVDTVSGRIERSVDLGQTWVTVADDLPLNVGLEDDTVPLNTITWYRAVAVSGWGTEAASEVVELDTATDKLWLTGLTNGAKIALECDLTYDPLFDQERVSEKYYGRKWPYSHYGEQREIVIAVNAGWTVQGIPCNGGMGVVNDPHDMLGQDLWYRDPSGRSFRAGFTTGIRLTQPNLYQQDVSFSVERVQV